MSDQRPSLTERRKATTQQEIALAAARLFAEHGAAGCTAEAIARAAGVSLRTFYRYFRTKEDAVAPLLSGGVRHWVTELALSPPELSVPEALEHSARIALSPSAAYPAATFEWVRGLLRITPTEPDLLAVWHRVHHESELALAPVLGTLAGHGADPLELRLAAAAANTAMRVALETWAETADPPERIAELGARCIRELTAGLRLWA
ncbi:TetR family transcriptional regulator [Kitasatospora sp. NPDC101801]|uniref:TetR family transcriptional regulator n=1 Tax=Kitasatospora sp. NPDC101801 TaxID=3364103 RepID=UPI003811F2DB